jgi:hypothetical protein
MDWISDNFQIVVLVVFAFASWLKHRMDAKAAEKEEMENQREYGDVEEDPRDYWEPEFETPQQPAVPPPLYRQAPPPLPQENLAPAGHLRQDEADAIIKRQRDLQERLRAIKESKANTTGNAAATRTRVAASQTGAKPLDPTIHSGLREALRDPKVLRRAIVTREILGPPLSLR